MDRLLRALSVLVTVTLVAYAIWLLVGDPEADEVVDGVIASAQDEDTPSVDRELRDRLRLAGRSPRGRSPGDGEADGDGDPGREPVVSSVPYGSGEIDSTTARNGFDHVMGKVEQIVEDRRRLSLEEWDALYREANDAFAALSIMLDARDDGELAELEAAHKRLEKGLGKVKVRGKKLLY